MAAKSKKKDELLVFPPLKDLCGNNTNQTRSKKLGNFGIDVILPTLDPVQDVNVFYGVKKVCKFVCEWYLNWRPWQKDVLLCSLSGKCSNSQLSSLSTILEPVFHRDFVSRLHGRYVYPVKDNLGERTGNSVKDCRHKKRKKRGKDVTDRKGKGTKVCSLHQEEIFNTEHEELKIKACIDNRAIIPDAALNESQEEKNIQDLNEQRDSPRKQATSSKDLIKENIASNDSQTQNTEHQRVQLTRSLTDIIAEQLKDTIPSPNLDTIQHSRSYHRHTANIYNENCSRKFFSASKLTSLHDMKANFPRKTKSKSRVVRRLSDLDAKCYKHAKWWTNSRKSKTLVSAHGINLWNHFTRQLKEINEIMDGWGDHEKDNLLSEVIKSSEPEQINFFAQCLIQRLKDHTDVSILPDRTILKIFSKLDARTLCQVSQVSRRWRYLGEDRNLWKQQCFQLGLSKGIKNLVSLIEKCASNNDIDWKQAYQEIHEMFQGGLHVDDDEENDREDMPEGDEVEELLEKEATKTSKLDVDQPSLAEIQTKHSLEIAEQIEVSVAQVDNQCSDDDITGGNLGLLQESLLKLTEGDRPQNNDELAIDIRPQKSQAVNEIDDNHKDEYQSIIVGVEDVKSVKRVRKLQGHMDGVFCVQFDSKRCLTGSGDHVLRMWDVRSGRGIRKMLGHLGGVRCANFDNTKIISGSWDTSIMIWDIVKFTRLGVLHGHEGCVSCLQFNSTYIVSGSHDRTIRVWDVNTWECLRVLIEHQGEITCLYLSGIYVLTGSTDRSIKLWNTESGQCLKTLVGHKSAVLSLQASRALVISGSEEGKIIFWDLESGEREAIIQGHDGACYCLFIWKNHFLSGGGDHLVKQWDISTMTCLRTLQGHKGPIQCVKMNSRRIVSCSEDGTARIWDLEVPVQKVSIDFQEGDKTLLPFDTLEHTEDELLDESWK